MAETATSPEERAADFSSRLASLADELHRAVNSGLDTAGRTAPLGSYKALMRDVRDELRSMSKEVKPLT